MSRIIIATFGSFGDLHPKLALALGLQARGHDVVLATSEPYRAKVAALGLPFLALRPDLSLENDALVQRVMEGVRGTEYLMRDLVYPSARDMYADLESPTKNADLLVASELVFVARTLAERTGVRWAYCALAPISFLSAHDPSVLPAPRISRLIQSLGPAANRLLLRVAEGVSHAWWRPLRRLRRDFGLPAGPPPLFAGKYSPHLNLAAFTHALQPPQPDWPAHTVQTGFLFHDENQAGDALPAPVEQFIRGGEPPIVFTLGSAAVRLARDFYVESARAARSLGRRALLLLGKNPAPPDLPPSIFAWDYLPYARIFPRAAAIVHQGGVGTTGQALRAGCPALVVPFAHDQFDNARRVTRLGAGRQLARSRYRAVAVARELAALLDTPAAKTAALKAAAIIRSELGVDHACDAIEQLLAEPAPRRATLTSA